MSSVGTPDPNSGWLSDEELADARRRLPLLYVEAVPVRVDGTGIVTEVGILLRANSVGSISRTLVSGRVMFGESLRSALYRHLEKDLGPMAFPQLPPSPVPFSVAEYFPTPGVGQFVDERQHAVSLAYVVPVTGTCDPRQDALEPVRRARPDRPIRRAGRNGGRQPCHLKASSPGTAPCGG